MKIFVKRFGVPAIALVFCVLCFGCSSSPSANYYNLGNVSEDNCALIDVRIDPRIVNPAYIDIDQRSNQPWLESDYPLHDVVIIDGQGSSQLWPRPDDDFMGFRKTSIVRVTPGAHTFTLTFYLNSEYAVPLNIPCDVKAGKGYRFEFLVQEQNDLREAGFFVAGGGKILLGLVNTLIIITEYNINEQGGFATFGTTEVARRAESFNFIPESRPNDMGRAVKRQN